MWRMLRRGGFLVLGLAASACWIACSSPTRPSCVYTVSRTSVSLPPAGGSDSVSVTTARGCSWSAASSASWLTITSGGTGTGNGVVAFSAAANGPSARSTTLMVADKAVAVSQDGLPLPTFTLYGKVTDAFIGSTPGIAGVSVTVSGGPSEGSATTDYGGTYTISDLLAGTYKVTFAKAFYVTGGATVVAVSGPTWLPMSLSLDVPAPLSAANLTGYWSGTGSYPNAPFKLALIQNGDRFSGIYADQHDLSPAVSGSYLTPEFTLRVDFGDAVLFLECAIEDAREVNGVHRTSALGNRPYPFTMKR